jgi:ABC1 atypical kinase-like domain
VFHVCVVLCCVVFHVCVEHVRCIHLMLTLCANLFLCISLPHSLTHSLSHAPIIITGDLHPGNIMVGKTENGKLKLLLLDCGLVVEMGPQQHVNLVKILGAFTRRKGRLAGQLMVDTSSDSQAGPLDVEMFVSGIARIVEDDATQNFVEKVGDYIADIMFLACKHKVKLEASFVNAALCKLYTVLYMYIYVCVFVHNDHCTHFLYCFVHPLCSDHFSRSILIVTAIEIIECIASALYPPIVVTKEALPLVLKAEMMHRLPKISLW